MPYNALNMNASYFDLNGNYTNTLIISNVIAGIMLGYMIDRKYDNPRYDKDYLYNIILGQLLLKSRLTEDEINLRLNSKDPKATIHNKIYLRSAFIAHSNGPYGIKEYAKRPQEESLESLGLANYVSISRILGYSIEDQDNGK